MKNIIILLLVLTSTIVCAQDKPSKQPSLRAFLSMPTNMYPYLMPESRDILAHGIDESVKGDTVRTAHAFAGSTTVLRYTPQLLDLQVTETMRVQIIVDTEKNQKDTIYYVIETFSGPESESCVYKYNKEWRNKQKAIIDYPVADFISEEKVEWKMLHAIYNPETKLLEIHLALPLMSSEEIDKVETKKKAQNVLLSALKFKKC